MMYELKYFYIIFVWTMIGVNVDTITHDKNYMSPKELSQKWVHR